MEGRFCRLEPIDPERHAAALFEALAADREGRTWTYLPYGPFGSFDNFRAWITEYCLGDDPFFLTLCRKSDRKPVGLASYLRIAPAAGVIEVGHLIFSPALQKTPAATEAMYLMMKHAFDLGYRRYEWKCDSLNAPSRAAAERLGFSFEGIFRQAIVYKRRNRDTAWYSIIDSEWPRLMAAFNTWLAPGNFNTDGTQRLRLSDLTRFKQE
jgi:RimJ/RimL family protein N-acetyltransferase